MWFNSRNKFTLSSKVDLTIGGSYQYENLTSKDHWYDDPREKGYAAASPWRTYPREGWRKEWNLNFRFDYIDLESNYIQITNY